jgi:transcription initiation factor TFIIIB Brf1 subunit/transcription initiation factor TFIIB
LPYANNTILRETSGVRKLKCPECQGSLIFPNGQYNEVVCKRCGLVITGFQDNQGFSEWAPEWYSNWDKGDSGTLREWLTALRTVSCQLHLPDFPYREEAARVIRKRSSRIFRSQMLGKNKKEAVTALVFIILRQYGEARSLKEMCETLSLDTSLVMKHSWVLRKMTKLERIYSPSDHLRYNAWKLTPNTELIKNAEDLLERLGKKVSGNPVSLAAGAFYHICKSMGLKYSKDEIGMAFHISGRTVYSNEKRISEMVSMNKL